MRISASRAIELLTDNPDREDVLWLKDNGDDEPVVAYHRQQEGRYTMALMSSNKLLVINDNPTEMNAIKFAQLPHGITWWDGGYEQHINDLIEDKE